MLGDGISLLLLLLGTELEVLAALDGDLVELLAVVALELEHDLLGGLGLLAEDGLCLTSVTLLLHVITALTCARVWCCGDFFLLLSIHPSSSSLSSATFN